MTQNNGVRRGRLQMGVVAGLVAAVVLAACSGGSGSGGGEPQAGGELTVGGGIAPTLDPAKGSANTMALAGYAIYDTLMIVEELGDEPAPNIAESLEPNDDSTEWTLTLRPDLRFSDGTDFDAEAVKYNMDRHIDPDVASTAAALLSPVEEVSVVDDLTVLFEMSEPFANFPYALAYDGSGTAGYIASPTALEEHGEDYTAHAAGAGPYMVESWAPDRDTVLVRNPHFWNNDEQEPYLDKVTITNIEEEQARLQALQAGDIDYAAFTDPAIMLQAQNDGQLNFVQGVGADQESIILNMNRPPFDDIRMRQAVSLAVNRQEIVDLTKEGMAEPAVNLFPAGDPYENDNAQLEYDLDEAKRLVAEYEADTGNDASFTYTCRPTVNTTDVIERQLSAAGMTVRAEVPESATAVAAYFSGDYQATCWAMAGFLTPDQLPYRFFHSGGDLNTQGYANSDFDALVEQARGSLDPEERKDLWIQADAILTEDLPWVWTTTYPMGFVSRQNVHSIDLDEPRRMRYFVPTFNNVWLSE